MAQEGRVMAHTGRQSLSKKRKLFTSVTETMTNAGNTWHKLHVKRGNPMNGTQSLYVIGENAREYRQLLNNACQKVAEARMGVTQLDGNSDERAQLHFNKALLQYRFGLLYIKVLG